MWIIPWDPFLMKKLLKSEICGPWTVHGMHWLVENCLTSQTLRLLFINSSSNIWLFPWTVHGVHCLRTYKFYFLVTFLLKMGLTVLFTYLKLFWYNVFQFSVSVFSFQLYLVSVFSFQWLFYLCTIHISNPLVCISDGIHGMT